MGCCVSKIDPTTKKLSENDTKPNMGIKTKLVNLKANQNPCFNSNSNKFVKTGKKVAKIAEKEVFTENFEFEDHSRHKFNLELFPGKFYSGSSKPKLKKKKTIWNPLQNSCFKSQKVEKYIKGSKSNSESRKNNKFSLKNDIDSHKKLFTKKVKLSVERKNKKTRKESISKVIKKFEIKNINKSLYNENRTNFFDNMKGKKIHPDNKKIKNLKRNSIIDEIIVINKFESNFKKSKNSKPKLNLIIEPLKLTGTISELELPGERWGISGIPSICLDNELVSFKINFLGL